MISQRHARPPARRGALRRVVACVALCATSAAAAPGAAAAGTGPADAPPSSRGSPAWQPPVVPVVAARLFDPPSAPWDSAHRGVDLLGQVDQEVRAPAGGLVVFSGRVVDRGVLTLLHPSGLRSSLEPVHSPLVEGDRVVTGDVVGTVEAVASHCEPETCVHWGVRDGEVYVDPMGLLGRPRAVLLPLRG